MSGLFGTTTIKGNRLTDFAQTTATVGVTIPFGYGAFTSDGNVIWAPLPPKEKRSRQRVGKGGTKQETYTYTLSYAVAFCKGPITRYLWIKRNGKIVYTTDPGASVEDTDYSAKWLEKATLYYGTATQLPDSTIESYEGSGQVSAFKRLAFIVVEDDDVTQEGGAVPTYEACVVIGTAPIITSPPYMALMEDRLGSDARSIDGELRLRIKDYEFAESITADAVSVGGDLDSLVDLYDITESVEADAQSVSGLLDLIVIAYTNGLPESVEADAASISGLIEQIVIPYTNGLPESISADALSVGGSLT